MTDIRTRWLTLYEHHLADTTREVFGHIEKMIVGTLVISAGAHVSSSEPSIALFGYLRHSFVGLGVEIVGVALLLLNFLDGLYKLARLNWHAAAQLIMSLLYVSVSVRLIQLILAFRGE
jgi:hypothetical protein